MPSLSFPGKSQAPSSKLQRNPKPQIPKSVCGNAGLELETSLNLGAWDLELSIASARESFLDIFDDESACLFRGHPGVVDHFSAERDHQRRGGALAVTLIAVGQIFIHAFGGPPFGTLIQVRVEIKLEICFRKNVGADIT